MPRPIPTLLAAASLLLAPALDAQGSAADYARAQGLRRAHRGLVDNSRVTPHWFGTADRYLWYRLDLGKQRRFVLVDAERKRRQPAFDHVRLAAALQQASGRQVDPTALPFRNLGFDATASKVAFRAFGSDWSFELSSGELSRLGKAPQVSAEPEPRRRRRGDPRRSPDRRSELRIREHNLWLIRRGDRERKALTEDGKPELFYESPHWCPDGRHVLVYRTVPGDGHRVPLIESSPKDQLVAKFRTRPYPRPGDKLPLRTPVLIDTETDRQIAVQVPTLDLGRPPWPRWREGGKAFYLERTDRGHKRYRIYRVSTADGSARCVLDEKTSEYAAGDTFINGWGRILRFVGDQILFASERDGHKHLYLIDGRSGERKQLTKGAYVVRELEHVDLEQGEITFLASGREVGQDPYFLHAYRTGLDGKPPQRLTAGDGTHRLQWSPSRRYLLDTWSRVDLAPQHALRDGRTGAEICQLHAADDSRLRKAGWRAPEPFVAKGRDGKTDIWGVIFRPMGFDPKRRYPVIENIYAGPHGSHVPKSFRSVHGSQALAELGFVVVQIDGMGTNNRSKAFHDVCWQDLADAGLPDRIAWMKAAARKYPQLDLDRVGIYGTSAGGQNAMGALLLHPEFYKVGVAACGCHDNRLDKRTWNEQWMGYPVGPHYAAQSNVTMAPRLQGKLFLIVGELDTNVPPESTMRVVDALIKADKDFDLLVIPGAGHTSGGRYGQRRRWDFFVRHLLGKEPRS